jgi:membrane protein YdbS with pleckstrin-like domain
MARVYVIIAGMHDKLTVKKSPIVIVQNFIGVQLLAGLFYFAAGFLAYYAEIWEGLPLAEYVPFQIAQAVFVFGAEVVLLFYFFISWYRQIFRITEDQLVYDQGVLSRKHTVVPLSKISSVSFSQNILGKLVQYGTIIVRDAQGKVLLRLTGMPEPQQLVDRLTESLREEGARPSVHALDVVHDIEHERLERKSTFRWDIVAGKVNKQLERAAMKTVAAFLNTNGGHLILGVADDHTVIGMEKDYATLPRGDADGFENHFSNVFNAMLGAHVRHLVSVQPFKKDDKECIAVAVTASQRPVYLSSDDTEEFFVRTGNGTTSLRLSEAAAYIESRWGNKK